MSDLQVSAWKRYGQDRLYVNGADGESVAWFDRRTGQIKILVEAFREAALEALAPYLVGEPPRSSPPAGLKPERPLPPVLGPEYDLALNQPGDSLRAKLQELSPGPFERLIAWLLRKRTASDSWRAGLAGERVVGDELKRLTRHGWRVLHSIPLPREVDIDHLLIGPGGVFVINTKNHRGKSVWVGDNSVKVNHGESHPYVRKSRQEAIRAARVLERGCGFPIAVGPMLVFVGPSRLDVVPSLNDVRAIRERELAALGPLTGALNPTEVNAVYAVARDRRNWAHA